LGRRRSHRAQALGRGRDAGVLRRDRDRLHHRTEPAGRNRVLDRAIWLDSAGSAGRTVGEMIPDDRAGMPEEYVFGQIDREQVRRLLGGIGQREAAVLCLGYGIGPEGPLARGEIAGRLGVTPERVRQIENQALERMRMALSEDG